MNATRRRSRQESADILAFGEDSKPVLLVEVKASKDAGRTGVLQLMDYLESSDFPFGMIADLEKMLIFNRDGRNPDSPLLALPTVEALSAYEPDFSNKRIFHDYLEGLIEAWLRDFAFHWKFERPPCSDSLEQIGLAQGLSGGMTRRGRRS